MTRRVHSDELIAHLERTRLPGPSGMAFDADGTLWAGDVGEDVFEFAYERGLFREEARADLSRVASGHGLPLDGTPSDLARRIYAAYRAGHVDERLVCEVMTWGYAGFTLDELRRTANESFEVRRLASRVRKIRGPGRDYARRDAIRVIVVSASPHLIVTEALARAGIEVFGVAGAEPKLENGRIAPEMAQPVPFAKDKCVAGLPLLSGYDWLASFGDNSFDVDLLRAARVPVAVCPKPALVARLHEIEGAFVLE
jgi:phosphatidylglycerophosphatase C